MQDCSIPFLKHWDTAVLQSAMGTFYTKSRYRQTSNISGTFIGNEIFGHSDVVGAAHVSAAPTISSLPTEHLASMDYAKKNARRDENNKFRDLVRLILEV